MRRVGLLLLVQPVAYFGVFGLTVLVFEIRKWHQERSEEEGLREVLTFVGGSLHHELRWALGVDLPTA